MNPFERIAPAEHTETAEGRSLLKQLEATGKYIFHGSDIGHIEKFELRQPVNWKNGEPVNHGEKSIVGTNDADVSIFRALAREDWTSFNPSGGSLGASKASIHAAEKSRGFVYVFNKDDFESFEGEWRSYKPLTPLKVISVSGNDLPPWIQVIHGNLR